MNTNTHTVTIPFPDYQELMTCQKEADKKYQSLKENLISALRQAAFGTHNRPTLEQLIDTIREA